MKCILSKKFLWCLGAFVLSLTFYVPVNACTAFSVKTDTNVYFAKNWDYYPDSEKNVTIHLEQMEDGLSRLVFRYSGFPSTSINSDGFVVTANDVYNITPGDCVSDPDTNIIDITQLRADSLYLKNIDEVKDYIEDKTVLCYVYAEHIFYADKSGKSCVLETDNEKHYIIESDDDFMVATNFPLYTLSSFDDVSKCSRYRAAYGSIKKNINNNFNLNSAATALKLSSQNLTIYSYVYDANENAVYLYLDRDFKTSWKFSFATNILSTYQGFENDTEFKLDDEGIRLMDLIKYQKKNKATAKPSQPTPTPTLSPTPETVPTPLPTINSTPKDPIENPETGDSINPAFWGMLTVTVAAGLTISRAASLRRKKD